MNLKFAIVLLFQIFSTCYSQSLPENALFYENKNVTIEDYSKYTYFASGLPNSIIFEIETREEGTTTYCIYPYFNDTFYIKKFIVRTIKPNDTLTFVQYDISSYKMVIDINPENKKFFKQFLVYSMNNPELNSGTREKAAEKEYWRYTVTNINREHFYSYKKDISQCSFLKRRICRKEIRKINKLRKIISTYEFVSLK